MGKLNLKNAIKSGGVLASKNERYDLQVGQIYELRQMNELDQITNSFYLGMYRGFKLGRKKKGKT